MIALGRFGGLVWLAEGDVRSVARPKGSTLLVVRTYGGECHRLDFGNPALADEAAGSVVFAVDRFNGVPSGEAAWSAHAAGQVDRPFEVPPEWESIDCMTGRPDPTVPSGGTATRVGTVLACAAVVALVALLVWLVFL